MPQVVQVAREVGGQLAAWFSIGVMASRPTPNTPRNARRMRVTAIDRFTRAGPAADQWVQAHRDEHRHQDLDQQDAHVVHQVRGDGHHEHAERTRDRSAEDGPPIDRTLSPRRRRGYWLPSMPHTMPPLLAPRAADHPAGATATPGVSASDRASVN